MCGTLLSQEEVEDKKEEEEEEGFPDFSCQSIYVPGMDSSNKLFYRVLIQDEKQSELDIAILWPSQPSDKSLYEATMQFLDEDHDN